MTDSKFLFIQETVFDRTRNLMLYEGDVFKTCFDQKGKLFRGMQKEHGRCTGKVYVEGVDPETGEPAESRQIGWVFEKLEKFTDIDEYYLRETWVTLHRDKPEKTIHFHYQYLDEELLNRKRR